MPRRARWCRHFRKLTWPLHCQFIHGVCRHSGWNDISISPDLCSCRTRRIPMRVQHTEQQCVDCSPRGAGDESPCVIRSTAKHRHARHARHEYSRWSTRGGVLAVEYLRWQAPALPGADCCRKRYAPPHSEALAVWKLMRYTGVVGKTQALSTHNSYERIE
jgi:hypothetical protein